MPKSTWNGSLVFGLLTLPVSLFTSVRDQHISLKQLCPTHHKPISQRKFCPGAPVAAEEGGAPAKPAVQHEVAHADLVHGYTLGEETVVFTSDELERAPVARNFEIKLCVPETEVDARFFEKPYIVGPRDASADRRGSSPSTSARPHPDHSSPLENAMFEVTHDLEGRPYPEPETDPPTTQQMREWMDDAVAEATDGCEIEPDGVCEHGHPSWLLRLGVI